MLKVADGLPGVHKAEILGLCDEVDILSRQLSDLCRRGHGGTPQAQDVARYDVTGSVPVWSALFPDLLESECALHILNFVFIVAIFSP